LLESKGEFLQFLDSDDTLHPDKIELQVDALRTHPDLDFVYGPSELIDNGLRTGDNRHLLSATSSLQGYLDGTCWWHIEGPLFRRQALAPIGLFDETIHGEDSEYFARALALGLHGCLVPDAWSRHRAAGADSYGKRHAGIEAYGLFLKGRLSLSRVFDERGGIDPSTYDALARTASGVMWSLVASGASREALSVLAIQRRIARSIRQRAAFYARGFTLRLLGTRITWHLWKRLRGW